ncbi:hypothetical protein BRADI_2g02681v3 [Brachypodium distachyon]|uniref:Uncharacterized protein n=1 Tax=Brachypodium distachyon TaxID=15368 RepID=A0A2K2D6K8_BRADI|nr:hypothetical protein BRADI_2g02681v3 [Brachypodium distachyon]
MTPRPYAAPCTPPCRRPTVRRNAAAQPHPERVPGGQATDPHRCQRHAQGLAECSQGQPRGTLKAPPKLVVVDRDASLYFN